MNNVQTKANTLEINGNIKGLDDFFQIKEDILKMELTNSDTLVLDIKNSFSMPSAMIGYLLKLIRQDRIQVILNVYDRRLLELLDDLNLNLIFNVNEKEILSV